MSAKDYYKGGFRVMRDGVPCKVFIKMRGDVAIRAKDWQPASELDKARAEVARLEREIAIEQAREAAVAGWQASLAEQLAA